MKSLVFKGAKVTLATEKPVDSEAIQWLSGVSVHCVHASGSPSDCNDVRKTSPDFTHEKAVDRRSWLKRRLASYWGYQHSHGEWTKEFIQRENVDVMVAVGLETLPYLDSTLPVKRIWYPADDPALHAYTLMRREGFSFRQLHRTTINIAYQRAFRGSVDAAWVVSSRDQKWMSRTVGFHNVDVIPNGVDASYYRPTNDPIEPNSCIFWGRLDFSPNVHALEFFLNEVWPRVRRESPTGQFHVCGAHPTKALRDLIENSEGVHFHENLDDLRPCIAASAVTVFPMVSGAGVKNKVLEAAAMAKPVLASEICLGGLSSIERPPFELLGSPQEWVSALLTYWSDSSRSAQAGIAARKWVTSHHSWAQSATAAIRSLEKPSFHLQPVPT